MIKNAITQAVQALQEMWDDLHKSGSPRVNARAMRYYSDALSTVESALLAAPAAPVGDEREAFEAFMLKDTSGFSLKREGESYEEFEVATYWHVWKARAALTAIGSAPVASREQAKPRQHYEALLVQLEREQRQGATVLPAEQDDEIRKKAARYDWMRDVASWDMCHRIWSYRSTAMDQAIDQAIATHTNPEGANQ